MVVERSVRGAATGPDLQSNRSMLPYKLLVLAGSTVVSLLALELILQGASLALRATRDRTPSVHLGSRGGEEYRIVCLGESTTEGYGDTPYPEMLARELDSTGRSRRSARSWPIAAT